MRVVLRVSEGVGSLQGLSITHVILYSGVFESFHMLDTAFAKVKGSSAWSHESKLSSSYFLLNKSFFKPDQVLQVLA
jgi:hypothetical protein